MDHPVLQLSIFLILAITDTSNAVYNRYVAKMDTKVSLKILFLFSCYTRKTCFVKRSEQAAEPHSV